MALLAAGSVERPVGTSTADTHNQYAIVDRRRFSALHQSGPRALFDHKGRIFVSTGDHGEWSVAFADVTGFNLPLTDKQSRTVPADPKCFFLPFYINQDGSWQADWNTFTGLVQFKGPLVVDAPNQQGQDEFNLPKVISFLSGKLPQKAQLILGSEIETDLSFERKLILTAQYELLSESDFDEAEVILGPLVSAMYLKA